jgi:hypothetical protein
MDEQTFMSGQATVTSSRIVINSKTFATRNVGSVGVTVKKPSRVLPVVLILFGLPWCFAKESAPVGLVLIVLGVIVWIMQKPEYSLTMMAGGGEVLALKTKDGPLAQKIHEAIAQAIAVR